MDVVQAIQAFNTGRDAEGLALKYSAMRASPFGFMRGSCHRFYARLPGGAAMKSAPLVWCCGDLHVANFGSYKGDDRLVRFDLSDFDEAALAPASWDLVRLLASVWIAAGRKGQDRADIQALCQGLLAAYADALNAGRADRIEPATAPGIVGQLLEDLGKRSRPDFLDARTSLKGARRVLRTDNGKALPATAAQRAAVLGFMADFAQAQPDPPFYQALDVARRVSGTGSLGKERYLVLVQGTGSPDGNHLLDLKRAAPSSLSPWLRTGQPRWPTEAHRIVELQRRMQAVATAFLQPVVLEGQPFVLRALHPSEDRIDFKQAVATPGGLADWLGTLGRLTAWAQLRSAARQGAAGPDELIKFGQKSAWRGHWLDAAEACALQVRQDAGAFNAAYDAGAFSA